MSPANQHFSLDEFDCRQAATRKALADLALDGLLLFKIEDIYWLSGLDTDGFCVSRQGEANAGAPSLFGCQVTCGIPTPPVTSRPLYGT